MNFGDGDTERMLLITGHVELCVKGLTLIELGCKSCGCVCYRVNKIAIELLKVLCAFILSTQY